jgi:hypothetical protein
LGDCSVSRIRNWFALGWLAEQAGARPQTARQLTAGKDVGKVAAMLFPEAHGDCRTFQDRPEWLNPAILQLLHWYQASFQGLR